MEFAPLYRFSYGIIGLIQRLSGRQRSRNTSTSFLRHVILKIDMTVSFWYLLDLVFLTTSFSKTHQIYKD